MLIREASKNNKSNIPLCSYKPDFDLKKIKINDVGKYSITRPYEAKQIIYYMKESISRDLSSLVITDGTAGVGGDTIHFSKYFKSVNAVDILSENTDMLKYNCEIFNINNVNIINDDYLKLYLKIKQDIIYLDPPWGGVGYKNKKVVDIRLGNMTIDMFVGKLLELGNPDIFLKLPLNADISKLNIMAKYQIYNKKNRASFFLIRIKNL